MNNELDLHLKYQNNKGRFSMFPLPSYWKNDFNEKQWIQELEDVKTTDLYIHIPFCKSLCTFCGCHTKITSKTDVANRYIEAILKEASYYKNKEIKTIYIGGGTPSFLPPQTLKELLKGLGEILKIDFKKSYNSMEVDPRHTTKEHLGVLAQFNFNRIIIGVQDTNSKVLDTVNRKQDFQKIKDVTSEARKFQISDISLDLIYGLPWQNLETTKKTFEDILSLNPSGIAYYPFLPVPWQNSFQDAFGDFKLPGINEKFDIYLKGISFLNEGYKHLGFGHFVNDKSISYKSRNITGFQKEKSDALIGLGSGSISQTKNMIKQNEKIIEKYQDLCFRNSFSPLRAHGRSNKENQVYNLLQEVILEKKIPSSIQSDSAFESLLSEGILKKEAKSLIITPLGTRFLPTICTIVKKSAEKSNIF